MERRLQGTRCLRGQGGWPDKASVGIPALYVNTGFVLYDALQTIGDQAGATQALADARQVARATRIADFFNFDAVAAPPAEQSPGDARPIVPLDVAPKDSPAKK